MGEWLGTELGLKGPDRRAAAWLVILSATSPLSEDTGSHRTAERGLDFLLLLFNNFRFC